MYWGDAKLNKIETSNVDGSGRRTLLTETTIDVHYFAFQLDAGVIHITDWAYQYVGPYHWFPTSGGKLPRLCKFIFYVIMESYSQYIQQQQELLLLVNFKGKQKNYYK